MCISFCQAVTWMVTLQHLLADSHCQKLSCPSLILNASLKVIWGRYARFYG
ncbi:Uncharacterised protein [Serratia fonticola]|uniref:Uncharacterized protein n=1 Tax=Serratia fonticola TaxID=47917 RepID=A0A4U9W0B5_SERFO|nr:Uncharacterised protein [Serratia fonticola]